jgi:adenine phosphoribosyltransferase
VVGLNEGSKDGPLQRLIRSFESIPVVRKNEYHYFVHPLSDGIPLISPEMLDDAVKCLNGLLFEPDSYDIFLTAEAMGIPLATRLSMEIGKPFSIARKREYGLPGEVKVEQSTGYSSSRIHLNLPREVGRAVIVDDVLSTGGTLISMTRGMDERNWSITGAVILFNKMGEKKLDLEEDLGYPIRTLLDIDLVDNIFKASISKY